MQMPIAKTPNRRTYGLKSPKFIILYILLLFSAFEISAQTAKIWYFGIGMGLDFSGSTPTLIDTYDPTLKYDNSGLGGYNVESSSTITDNSGNLIFIAIPTASGTYSVLDKNFASVGTVATTSDAAQGSLVFPRPGTTNQYYLCTVDAMTGSCGSGDVGSDRGANYYLVTNTGSTVTLGAKQTALSSGVAECQVGIPKANGTDYWWIVHERGNANFKVFSVTNSGITLASTQSVGYTFGSCDYVAQLAVNDCNTQIAMTIAGTVSLFNFDNSTGTISNVGTGVQWTLSCAYGLEFSTNGKYLFVSTGTQGGCSTNIYQYDISSGVTATITGGVSNLGATAAGSTGKSGHLQLGPDGNIYVAQMTQNGPSAANQYLGQISNINSKPATFNNAYLTVSDADFKMAVTMGLPTIMKAFITGNAHLQLPNANSICVGSNSTFSYNFSGDAVSQVWSLSPSTGFSYVSSSSTSASPTINFTSAGIYKVKVVVTDNCGYTYPDSTNITVNNQVNSSGTISCGPNVGNVISPNGAYTYVWYSDAALTKPMATGTTNVSLPIAGSGTAYLVAASSASTSGPVSLTNGTTTVPNDNTVAGTSVNFTVNKSVLSFQSFEWRSPDASYSASTVTKPYTITLKDLSSNTYYTNTRNVVVSDASNSTGVVYTENVNLSLMPGTYVITISGGNVRSLAGWDGCASNLTDAQSALTYNTNSANCIVTNLQYKLSTISVTPLACSNSSAISYNCPLPVVWFDFFGKHTSSGNFLEWSTTEEVNNSYYVVLRSEDGINFEEIATVKGVGNSKILSAYTYNDTRLFDGPVYYQLKQVDIDGRSNYSKVISVESSEGTDISVYPNPNNGLFEVSIHGNFLEDEVLQILNGFGQVVYSKTIASTISENQLNIQLSDLAKGVYYLKVMDKVEKIVIE